MSAKMIKDGKEYPIGVIPKNYPASNISYNNSQSGLSATKVQEAIDEVEKTTVGEITFVSTPYVGGGTFIKKINGIKMLQLAISSISEIIPTGSWVKVMSLPIGFRPNNDLMDNRVNTDGHYFAIRILINGDVEIYNYASNTKVDGAYLITFI